MLPQIFDLLNRPSVFVTERLSGQYLFDTAKFTNKTNGQNLWFIINADTEYTQPDYKDHVKDKDFVESFYKGEIIRIYMPEFDKRGRWGVTSQFSCYPNRYPKIYAHKDLIKVSNEIGKPLRHKVAISGFHPVDYLNDLGYKCSIKRVEKMSKLPVMQFVIAGHFLLAELLMIVEDEYRDDVLKILPTNAEMRRRLRFFTKNGKVQSDDVSMPWVITIDGIEYAVSLCFIDTSAVHGIASYATFCAACNIILDNKHSLDDVKNDMHLAYFLQPDVFDKYAIGDLKVFEALINNADNFYKVWDALDIKEFYTPPKLTIGSTVKDIFLAKIYKLFKRKPGDYKGLNKLIKDYCERGTSQFFKVETKRTRALLAKVFGGRCWNNRPTVFRLLELLVDIDISGCYGEGQRNQLYAFGNPVIDDFELLDEDNDNNDYLTLREWLTARKWGKKDCELVPGLWHSVVFTKKDFVLEYPQDFIQSWVDFKIKDIINMKSDGEIDDNGIEVKTGEVKIFTNQVINGVLTHDAIQWIYKVCGQKQCNELLDNLYVKAALYYPSYERVYSTEELEAKYKSHSHKNKSVTKNVNGRAQRIEESNNCHAWYGVNMGEFIIDTLMFERKKYDKNIPGEKPFNTLYKLCINTLYGDMVSPYFCMGNVVVGNNITARARAMCYYAEKGLNSVQSITDGGVFQPNKVVYPTAGHRLTASNLVNLHHGKLKDKNIKLAPLGGYDEIAVNWLVDGLKLKLDKIEFEGVEALNKINSLTIAGYDKVNAVWSDSNGLKLTIYKNSFREVWEGSKALLELNKLKPIGHDKLVCSWGCKGYQLTLKLGEVETVFKGKKAMQWVDETALKHLQNLFDVDVLKAEREKLLVEKDGDTVNVSKIKTFGQYDFEMKDFYKAGAFHGSANYYLVNPVVTNMAMRSYEKKSLHYQFEIDYTGVVISDYPLDTPANNFLPEFLKTGKIKRSKVFVKKGILKIKQYLSQKSWDEIGRLPGDTIEKRGLLREFSKSQFTFKTYEQYKSITKEMETNKRAYEQTYEFYFLVDNENLDYGEMIETIDKLIVEGAMKLNTILDKNRHRARDLETNHPEKEVLIKVRECLLREDFE